MADEHLDRCECGHIRGDHRRGGPQSFHLHADLSHGACLVRGCECLKFVEPAVVGEGRDAA